MFGRRRRAARAAEAHDQQLRALELHALELHDLQLHDLQLRAAELEASASTECAQPTISLTTDAVTALLHQHLGELIGAGGVWTLVPRSSDDTEVFFHDLKALEIAHTLSDALQSATTGSGTATRARATVHGLGARFEPIGAQPSATTAAATATVESAIAAQPIATATATAISNEAAAAAAATVEVARPVSTSTLTTPITEPAEPTALPWAPRPVTHWTEPAPVSAPIPARDKAARR